MTHFNAKDYYPADETDPEKLRYMLEGWIESAASAENGCRFYRNIITEIGEMFGEAAKTSDDGSIQDSVLVLKVPELVAALIKQQAKPLAMQMRHSLELLQYRSANPDT